MSLTKTPKKAQDAAAFIGGAPDAQTSPGEGQQNKKPITITFDPVLLEKLDQAAKRKGLSRSSAMAVAVAQWLGIE